MKYWGLFGCYTCPLIKKLSLKKNTSYRFSKKTITFEFIKEIFLRKSSN